MPATLNPEIVEAIQLENDVVLGRAPAIAIGTMQQSTAHSVSMAMHNAVSSQQHLDTLMTATLGCGLAALYSVPEV